MIDERTIRCWWDVFKSPDMLTEVRVLSGGKTWSGYFTDPDTMLTCLKEHDGKGIYATINEINPACYDRMQRDRIIQSPKSTTNDNNIDRRRILLLDFDPERPSDTNSSDEEKALAEKKMREVYKYLRNQGFNAPVVADSANGYHLYYKIDADNSEETTNTIKNVLKALDILFSDDKVKVDTSVFNASRIAKIIGTSSNKGTNTKKRPQRTSFFLHIPENFSATDMAYLKKIAEIIPEEEKPSRFNNYSSQPFDLRAFIQDHNIKIAKEARFNGGTKFILEECPFDSNHKAPDAALFMLDNGAIGFRCLHNSCSHYSWKDFRLHFDPSAYSKSDYEEFRHRRTYYGRVEPKPIEPLKEDERGKIWLEMSDIKWVDPSQLVSIASGIEDMDRKIMGFTLGDLTILSGLSGAGKTTLLDNFNLSAIQRGFKVANFSGELQDFRFQAWLDQMAAGKAFVKQKPGYDNLYYCPKNIADKINEWLKGKLFLYNNGYGNEWGLLFDKIKEVVETKHVQMVLVDNLMTLNLNEFQGEENARQTAFINQLKDYCKTANIHALLVCHPRKEQSFQLLRKESIAGTANLTNLCDNLLISHRVGKDFQRRASEFFGDETVEKLMGFDLVLEIAKNRSIGVVDHLIGLYYEPETRRIKNSVAESITYGWLEEPTQISIPDMPDEVWNNGKF